jgi:hypothetical protein
MASTLKVDQIETPSGVGNISFAQPVSGDGSQLTGVGLAVGGGAVVAGDFLYHDGTEWTRLPKGTASQYLRMNVGATAPEWIATTGAGIPVPAGAPAAGDILYYDGSNYVRLAKGTAGQQLAINAGATAPEWITASGGGKTLQHKEIRFRTTSSFTDQWPNDNTIPQNSEGVAVTELAITPESATSTLYIDYWVTFARSNHDMGSMALFVDTDVDAIAVSSAQGNTNMYTMFGNYSVVSASTSARTYKLRTAASPGGAGTMYLNMAHSSASWWGAGTIPNSGIRIYEMEA